MKRIRPRKFYYTPRFFVEEKEENEDGRRIKFKRLNREDKKRSPILKLVLLALVILGVLFYLNDITYFKIW